MRQFCVVFLLSTASFAQNFQTGCDAEPETLRKLEALSSISDYEALTFEERIGSLRELARGNPHDFFIQRRYQQSLRRIWYLADEYDRALEMYRSRNDKMARYWEARLLMMAQPGRATKVFAELRKSDPQFIWPQLDELEWLKLPGRRDPKEAEARIRAFREICPESTALLDADLVRDPELLQALARGGRTALQRRNSPVDIGLWPSLWTLESRLGLSQRERQERVRRDLERLEALPFRATSEWQRVYVQAAQHLGDAGLEGRFETRVRQEAPGSPSLRAIVESRWHAANPRPGGDATPEHRTEYKAKLAKAHAEWRQRWPKSCGLVQRVWMDISPELALNPERRPAEEVLALADQVLQCRTLTPDILMSVPSIEVMIAEAYVHLKQRLDEVPRLLKAGLQNSVKQEKYRISRELMPPEVQARAAQSEGPEQWVFTRVEQVRFDYLMAIEDFAGARTLAQYQLARLLESNSQADSSELARRSRQTQETDWNLRIARALEAEGQAADALSHYKKALNGLPRQIVLKPVAGSRIPKIRALYLAHGGTAEKWLEWATSPAEGAPSPAEPPPPSFTSALPQFSAKDLSGRTWDLSALKGKGTLFNFWATWCGPCRGEHVELQKLFELIKGRADVQLVTINVDADPSAVARYLKETGYAFPVIHDPALADRLMPWAGLPANFLVNRDTMRTYLYYFAGGSDGIQAMVRDLGRAAGE